MMIGRWQPFDGMETLRRQIDQVFDDFQDSSNKQTKIWAPAIELEDTAENLLLRVLLPGIDRNDIDIQVTREAVSIAGERRYPPGAEDRGYFRSEFPYGNFHRIVSLPLPVQQEKASADFCNGILTLILPKSEEYRHRVVKINLGETAFAGSPTSLEALNQSSNRSTTLATV